MFLPMLSNLCTEGFALLLVVDILIQYVLNQRLDFTLLMSSDPL